jgi:PHD/YefM family antitoxin component YafN of YafNO toxin-antitoxin module
MKKTGEPIVLTVNGKAAAVVCDPDVFEDLAREKDRRDMVASVKRGIEDMNAGRTKPAEKVFREFEKKYNISS